MLSIAKPESTTHARWHEILSADGAARPLYQEVLGTLRGMSPVEIRGMEDRMAAILREMGVTFDMIRDNPWGRHPWSCDLLPQIFGPEEWTLIVQAFRQRLRAFEALLADVYGPCEILRAGVIPVQAVRGSPNYVNASVGLPRPRDAYLHLSGMGLARGAGGELQVKQHHFSYAMGMSFMLQNRRALARVAPELFATAAVQSLTESSVLMLEQLREAAAAFGDEPMVVLLSPGTNTAVSSELSFLARRMGMPMVQGGDLLVLEDCVWLKTVRGLEKVEVIFNCVPDAWLDPLVFRRDSTLGVPGLVHCLRKGTVALVNGVGSQLADDRSLLAFTTRIISFYLREAPIIPTVPTLWMGDIDQREFALENLQQWRICPLFPSQLTESAAHAIFKNEETLTSEVRRNPSCYVAQAHGDGATTIGFEKGRAHEHTQDHIVYAVRSGTGFDILPGALTRVMEDAGALGEHNREWKSKDTWVLSTPDTDLLMPRLARRTPDAHLPARQVTSRVADAFYWMGRYLERAHSQAYLISVVETLETEELNSAERKHYRPMWNRLLPPIEKHAGTSRRSISNRIDRYRLVLLQEPGSVVRTVLRAISNAESVQDSLSPEAWATINELRARFQRTRFRNTIAESDAVRVTRRMADATTQLIPQFFAVAANTMLADDGWRFCETGQMLERAIITANATISISNSFTSHNEAGGQHKTELELSAFLRLLGTRDAYRRIYQMRAEPAHVLALLWQDAEVPRSVVRCLARCADLLGRSVVADGTATDAPAAIERLIQQIRRVDWTSFVHRPEDEDRLAHLSADEVEPVLRSRELEPLLRRMLGSTLELHTVIGDSFLNHQARIAQFGQPMLRGWQGNERRA